MHSNSDQIVTVDLLESRRKRMAAVYDAIDGESLWKDGEGKQIMRCMRW